jgi:hypothetical protein
MSIRKTWWFNNYNKNISIELCWFGTPLIQLIVDGGEREFMIHLNGLLFGIFITFNNFLPKKWYPQDKSETYGTLPGKRELSLKIHHYCFWWCFWKDPDCWNSTDSKWISGSFDFKSFLIGKHEYRKEELMRGIYILSFLEGNYSVEVVRYLRYDSWQRWFTRKMTSYEVTAGYYHEGKFIELGIPLEGKGENSWDCGETYRSSMTFPAKRKDLNIKNCFDAALYFEQDLKKDRVRYGGSNWRPQISRVDKLQVFGVS